MSANVGESYNEQILRATIDGETYVNENPYPSRIETLLMELNDGLTTGKMYSESVIDLVNVYENVSITWESTTGAYNGRSPYALVAINSYKCVMNVSPGEKYRFFGNAYYDLGQVIFFNSSNAVIGAVWLANSNRYFSGVYFTVPDGCATMRLQKTSGSYFMLQKESQQLKTGNSLDGAYVSVIGDSITEKNNRATTNWVMYIADKRGCTIQNLGTSGTGFATTTAPYKNRITAIKSDTNLIGVALSFNDLSTSKSVGDPTDTDETTLCGCANVFFDSLITAFPATPIVAYIQSPWGAYHAGESDSDAWVAAFKTICENRGIPFYDALYYGGALKPWLSANRAVYYVSDGDGTTDQVHPNSEGHKIIAAYLADKFKENMPI